MRRSIRFDLRVQLLLIPLRRHRDFLLHALLQVRVRLDVRSVHKHDLRRQISRPGHFLQYPAEHALDHFRSKAMAERIADRRKVRKTLRHRIAQKPAIRHVHLRIPHGLTQRMDSEQMLDQYQLEQHHRIAARPTVVLAVQILDHLIYVMCVKSTAASIFRSRCSCGTSISVHSISIACRCSVSFFSIFITSSIISEKAAFCDLF